MRKGLFICLIAGLSAPAAAQENPSSLEYKQALEMAFANNAGLAAREDAVIIEESRISQARAAYFPRLSVFSSYSRSSLQNQIELLNPLTGSVQKITFTPENRYGFGLAVSHDLYSFGRKRATIRASQAGAEKAALEREEYRHFIYNQVTRSFLSVLLARDILDIQRDNVKRAGEKLQIVEARVGEGLAGEYDLVRARILEAEFRSQEIASRTDYKQAISALKKIIGWSYDHEFLPVGELADFEIAAPDSIGIIPDNQLLFMKLEKSLQAGMEAIKMNKSAFYPVLGLTGRYDWQNGYQPDIDKLEDSWSAGVSLNWLLFDGGERKSKIRQARLETDKIRNLMDDLLTDIRMSIETSEIAIEAATEELTLSNQRLTLADKGLAIAEARYWEGLLGISDLLDLEVERSKAQIGLNSAYYRLASARLDLKGATGYYPELK